MQKIVALVLILVAIGFTANAQKGKKPAKRTTTKKVNKAKIMQPQPLTDMYIKNDDGSVNLEMLNVGDKLVYAVKAGGQEYEFIVTLKVYNYLDGIQFEYEMTNENNTKGSIFVTADAKRDATSYMNYFRGGDVALTDAITVWLSQKNFADMPNKKTEMKLDNNEPTNFYRPDNDEVAPTINLKGKQVKIDGFIINNAVDGKGDKTMWIQNASGNPLILKMDIGFVVELKEIR